MKDNKEVGGYMVDGDLHKIKALVRQAVELGADVIKADPTDDVSEYHQVIEVAGRVPVLVRGGGRGFGRRGFETDSRAHGSRGQGHRLRAQRHPARRPARHDAGGLWRLFTRARAPTRPPES